MLGFALGFRYQENGEKLVVDNFKLSEELETQKLNLRDINEFLTNELKARSLTTSALESKVQELNVLVEDVRRSHEVRPLEFGCIRWKLRLGSEMQPWTNCNYKALEKRVGHVCTAEQATTVLMHHSRWISCLTSTPGGEWITHGATHCRNTQ